MSEAGHIGGVLPPGTSVDDVVTEVRRVLDASLRDTERVVVGLSGGADSVALTWALTQVLRPDRIDVVHVRHGLRDDSADAAAALLVAQRLGLAFHEVAVNVAEGKGPEAAARDARYGALHEVAAKFAANVIVVAHTAEDQAETVLLNLARGTGLKGAAGMATSRAGAGGVRIVRPLLRVRRADVRAMATAAGLAWIEDPTNDDPAQRRARARHELLPTLAGLSGANADPVRALVRFANHARREDRALEVLAEREFRRIGRRWGAVLALPFAALHAMPEGLALRVLRAVVSALDEPPTSARELQRVLSLAPGQAYHRRGLRATCGGGWLAMGPQELPALAPRTVVMQGVTPLPELDLAFHADDSRAPVDQHIVASGPPGARLPLQARLPVPTDAELTLRPRAPGDRIRLRYGTRSLQDLLTDAGAPRLLRDLLPVVVDASDEPVWVPGFAVARMPESLSLVRAWLAHPGAR